MWTETFGTKKPLFADARVAVGGRDDCSGPVRGGGHGGPGGPGGDEDYVKYTRKDTDLEPVFYHSHGETLYEELLLTVAKRGDIKGIIDLTAGDGCLAQVAIKNRIPYLGFCLTELHMKKLTGRLRSWVWKAFTTEGSELYESGLNDVLAELPADGDHGDEDGEGEAEPQGKAGRPKTASKSGRISAGMSAAAKKEVAQKKANAKNKAKAKGKAKAQAEGEAAAEEDLLEEEADEDEVSGDEEGK
jgi:hypothetical protein